MPVKTQGQLALEAAHKETLKELFGAWEKKFTVKYETKSTKMNEAIKQLEANNETKDGEIKELLQQVQELQEKNENQEKKRTAEHKELQDELKRLSEVLEPDPKPVQAGAQPAAAMPRVLPKNTVWAGINAAKKFCIEKIKELTTIVDSTKKQTQELENQFQELKKAKQPPGQLESQPKGPKQNGKSAPKEPPANRKVKNGQEPVWRVASGGALRDRQPITRDERRKNIMVFASWQLTKEEIYDTLGKELPHDAEYKVEIFASGRVAMVQCRYPADVDKLFTSRTQVRYKGMTCRRDVPREERQQRPSSIQARGHQDAQMRQGNASKNSYAAAAAGTSSKTGGPHMAKLTATLQKMVQGAEKERKARDKAAQKTQNELTKMVNALEAQWQQPRYPQYAPSPNPNPNPSSSGYGSRTASGYTRNDFVPQRQGGYQYNY